MLVSRSHSIGGKVDEYLADETIRDRIPQGSALKFGGWPKVLPISIPASAPPASGTQPPATPSCWLRGSLSRMDGGTFNYGKPKFLNPGFVAF